MMFSVNSIVINHKYFLRFFFFALVSSIDCNFDDALNLKFLQLSGKDSYSYDRWVTSLPGVQLLALCF